MTRKDKVEFLLDYGYDFAKIEEMFFDDDYLKEALVESKNLIFIFKKITEILQKYSVENLDNIGCFVVLENLENQLFEVAEMEFTEVLEIGNLHYLHGVKILGDSYGEDVYLPIEVRKC